MRSIKFLVVCVMLFVTNLVIGQSIAVTDNNGIPLQMDINKVFYGIKNKSGQTAVIEVGKNTSYTSTQSILAIQTLGCNKFYVFKVAKKNGSFSVNDTVMMNIKYAQVQQTSTGTAVVKSTTGGITLVTVESYTAIINQANTACNTPPANSIDSTQLKNGGIAFGDLAPYVQSKIDAVGTDFFITTNTVITVGSGGTYATLADALTFLNSKTITTSGFVTISMLAGDHFVSSLTFSHPQGSRIKISGATMLGAIPTIANMTGDRATDSIFVRSRYATKVYLSVSGGLDYGMNITGDLDNIENIAFFAAPLMRYPISINGFNVSWTEGKAVGNVKFTSTTHFGGVWGFAAGSTNIICRTKMFFCYQSTDGLTSAGGGMVLRNSNFLCELVSTNLVEYYANSAIETPKNFVALINSYFVCHNSTLKVNGVGTVVLADASSASITGAILTNCGQLANLTQNSNLAATSVNCNGFLGARIENAADIYKGYGIGTARPLLFLGFNCTATIRNLVVENCSNTYLLQSYFANVNGFGITINNSLFTTGLGLVNSGNVEFIGTLTNPQGGSIDVITVSNGGILNRTGSTGFTTSPAVATFTAAATVR